MSARGLHGLAAFLLLGAAFLITGCGEDDGGPPPATTAAYPQDDTLRLNQIQVVGSHNSFHIQPQPELYRALLRFGSLVEGWGYTHPPLGEQFETQGVRQIELDVLADPPGGLFANRAGMAVIHKDTASGIPELSQPGFKVMHIPDLDFESNCWTFVECLQTVKRWSDANPGHVPIMILIECKDDQLPVGINGAATLLHIGRPEFDALDAEIRSVFPPAQIITPDEVRGSHATLAEAIRIDGWPTLGQTRGRVLFTLDNGDVHRDDYIAGHPSLRGRILFTSSPADAPEAAFMKFNDPIGDFDKIRAAVAAGYVVRTRTDADTVEARANNTGPRDTAIASGAQWVSTDYPVADPTVGTDYHVTLAGGMPARCNPLNAPARCTSLDIENPRFLSSR